jgi:hypothetical protein
LPRHLSRNHRRRQDAPVLRNLRFMTDSSKTVRRKVRRQSRLQE